MDQCIVIAQLNIEYLRQKLATEQDTARRLRFISDDELLGLLAILRSTIAEEGQKEPANGNPEATGEIEPGGTPKLISSNVMESDEKEHFTEGQRGLPKKLDQ
jgi:hypothetical protein